MKRWSPTILFFAFVCGIIFLADEGYARGFFGFINNSAGGDKLGHFVLIGGLAFFLNLSLSCRAWRRILIGSLIVAALCTLEEISQAWSQFRHFDLADLAADYAGIWLAGWLAQRVSSRAATAAISR